MSVPDYQIRRATLDDLPQLRQLWAEYQFDVHDLEKRFTEFKVVMDDQVGLQGTLGFQIHGHHARLHSEAFTHPEIEDDLRKLMWDRLQTLALNHGIIRFWTLETAPFWKRYAGFKEMGDTDRPLLPPNFGDPKAHWLTLPLHEETQPSAILEQHLSWFKQMQQENTNRMMLQARVLRGVATLIALLLFLGVVLAGIYLVRRRPV